VGLDGLGFLEFLAVLDGLGFLEFLGILVVLDGLEFLEFPVDLVDQLLRRGRLH
jgi:hypothetical protein